MNSYNFANSEQNFNFNFGAVVHDFLEVGNFDVAFFAKTFDT